MTRIRTRLSALLRARLSALLTLVLAAIFLAAGTAAAAPAPPPPPPGTQKPTAPPPTTARLASVANYQILAAPWTTVPPGGGFAWSSVACPAGTHVLGGGEYNTSAGDITLLSTSPDPTGANPDGWFSTVENRASTPAQFRAYVICGSGLTAHQIVQRTEIIRPHAGVNSYPGVACPDGLFASGGGLVAPPGITIHGTREAGARYAWASGIVNNTTVNVGEDLFAVCVSGPAFTYVYGAPVQVAPGGYGTAFADCPAGMSVLGGGGVPDPDFRDIALTDSYPQGSSRWVMYARNNESVPLGLRALAVCGT